MLGQRNARLRGVGRWAIETLCGLHSRYGPLYDAAKLAYKQATGKASGWQPLGFSKGFERHRCEFYIPNDRPKKLWVKELQPDAREILIAKSLPEAHASAETDGNGVRSPLKAKELRTLSEVFRQIPDPRPRANMRYPLPAVLSIISIALLGGAIHISEILRAGQRLSQQQREQIGLRCKRGTKFRPAPS